MNLLPVTLFQHGFTDLVSVIPPNATLSPRSKISVMSLGKTPGLKYSNGTWGGYDWLKHVPTEDEVRQWALAGANIGLLGKHFPAVDIDVLNPTLADIIAQEAKLSLGFAPKRTGRAPKTLLLYRLDGAEPFGRMAVKLSNGREEHLVEVLGAGRQYVIHGTHPSGRGYEWDTLLARLVPQALTPISRAGVETFFANLTTNLSILGWDVLRLGDERHGDRITQDSAALRAPTLDALEAAVSAIPNTSNLFPERTDYIKMGYAIRAAATGLSPDDGEYLFAEWALRWTDGRNDPDTVRSDWRRMSGPYAIGWGWLAAQAGLFGFNAAGHEFEATAPEAVQADADVLPPTHSDQWLAEEVIKEHGDQLRYVPLSHRWMVWDSSRWATDAVALAEHRVGVTLRQLSDAAIRHGATPAEQRQAKALADILCSSGKRESVAKFVKTDPRLTVDPASFDGFPWLLNTPIGIVNLKSGVLGPHDPGALLTKQTAVGPDFGGACPEFRRFLTETTGGDARLEDYLQRVIGYCLTGSTVEQVLFFIWGPGGNGKSVLLNTISLLLGDYARQAPMEMFTASNGDRHPADLASLQGARLVAASETQAGKRWDEARMKSLTGGERVAARFMHGDFFQYSPQFKLLFVGNHKPEIRDIDAAMRRRIHLIPFIVTPVNVDKLLSQKLEIEWPAILAWAIEGCLKWQASGLMVPDQVRAVTEEYFAGEDSVGRWLADSCDVSDPAATAYTLDLYESWRQWANRNGEYVGSTRRLVHSLAAHRLTRWMHPEIRRNGFRGIRLREQTLENSGV